MKFYALKFRLPLVCIGLVASCAAAGAQQPLSTMTDSASYAIGMNFTVSELIPSFDILAEKGIVINKEILARTISDRLLERPTEYGAADSSSYILGVNMSNASLLPVLNNLKTFGVPVNREAVARAVTDVLSGSRTAIPDSSAQRVLVMFQQKIMEGTEDLIREGAERNKKEEQKFLEANRTKEGVKTTPSGLQYVVLEKGSGASPTLTDSVAVRCRGTFLNGTVFDRTPEGESVTCAVAGVIPGWTEALQMMKPGSKWMLYIPSQLGFGEGGGLGGKVGPNQLLVYEVELVAVK